jgi:hypothetical protein
MSTFHDFVDFLEELYIKLTKKGPERNQALAKVADRKRLRELELQKLQEERERQRQEQEALRLEQEARERAEVEQLLSQFVDTTRFDGYTEYEFQLVKRDSAFFRNVLARVFEPNERGLTFIFCEFDKSKKREINGYLLVTDKRALFLTRDLTFMDKFRYQTIINVTWFRDGGLERGIRIQYGKRTLEFDEIFDMNQLQRVADLILQLSSNVGR